MDMLAIQPTDIAIFLVSFAACVYCIVLSRRLKALQDTRDGLGATIVALSKSVSAVSSATNDTRAQAGELASRLSQLMQDADAMCDKLSDLTESMEASHAKASRHAHAAKSELTVSMADILNQSKERSVEMKNLLAEMKAHNGRIRSAVRDTDFLFEDDDAQPLKRTL